MKKNYVMVDGSTNRRVKNPKTNAQTPVFRKILS